MAPRRIAFLTACLVTLPAWAAPDWAGLSAGEQRALAPLSRQWNALDDDQREQWRGIVQHFDELTPQEQARVRERMKTWTGLSAQERQRALQQYRALRSRPPAEREALHERWQEYQNLSPEERARMREAARARGNERQGRGKGQQ